MKKISNHGFSLLEVLIAMGLVGTLTTVSMRLSTNMLDTQKTMTTKSSSSDVVFLANAALRDAKSCQKTLEGKNASGSGVASIDTIVNSAGNTIIAVGTPYGTGEGQLTIKQITWNLPADNPVVYSADINKYVGQISLNYTFTYNSLQGSKSFNKQSPLMVIYDKNTGVISDCYTGGLDIESACTSLGGLYYQGSCKSILITSSTPTTNSTPAITTSGDLLVSAGNILVSGGNISVSNGNISTTGDISADGNLAAGNISATGTLKSTGSLSVNGAYGIAAADGKITGKSLSLGYGDISEVRKISTSSDIDVGGSLIAMYGITGKNITAYVDVTSRIITASESITSPSLTVDTIKSSGGGFVSYDAGVSDTNYSSSNQIPSKSWVYSLMVSNFPEAKKSEIMDQLLQGITGTDASGRLNALKNTIGAQMNSAAGCSSGDNKFVTKVNYSSSNYSYTCEGPAVKNATCSDGQFIKSISGMTATCAAPSPSYSPPTIKYSNLLTLSGDRYNNNLTSVTYSTDLGGGSVWLMCPTNFYVTGLIYKSTAPTPGNDSEFSYPTGFGLVCTSGTSTYYTPYLYNNSSLSQYQIAPSGFPAQLTSAANCGGGKCSSIFASCRAGYNGEAKYSLNKFVLAAAHNDVSSTGTCLSRSQGVVSCPSPSDMVGMVVDAYIINDNGTFLTIRSIRLICSD